MPAKIENMGMGSGPQRHKYSRKQLLARFGALRAAGLLAAPAGLDVSLGDMYGFVLGADPADHGAQELLDEELDATGRKQQLRLEALHRTTMGNSFLRGYSGPRQESGGFADHGRARAAEGEFEDAAEEDQVGRGRPGPSALLGASAAATPSASALADQAGGPAAGATRGFGSLPQFSTTLELLLATCDSWKYRDPQGNVQGPFSRAEIIEWSEAGYFPQDLPLMSEEIPKMQWTPLAQILPLWQRAMAAGPAFAAPPPPAKPAAHQPAPPPKESPKLQPVAPQPLKPAAAMAPAAAAQQPTAQQQSESLSALLGINRGPQQAPSAPPPMLQQPSAQQAASSSLSALLGIGQPAHQAPPQVPGMLPPQGHLMPPGPGAVPSANPNAAASNGLAMLLGIHPQQQGPQERPGQPGPPGPVTNPLAALMRGGQPQTPQQLSALEQLAQGLGLPLGGVNPQQEAEARARAAFLHQQQMAAGAGPGQPGMPRPGMPGFPPPMMMQQMSAQQAQQGLMAELAKMQHMAQQQQQPSQQQRMQPMFPQQHPQQVPGMPPGAPMPAMESFMPGPAPVPAWNAAAAAAAAAPPTKSLKEIQEEEARRLAAEQQQQARARAAQEEAAKAAAAAAVSPPPAPAWTAAAAPAKSLKEIQEEEERMRRARGQQAAPQASMAALLRSGSGAPPTAPMAAGPNPLRDAVNAAIPGKPAWGSGQKPKFEESALDLEGGSSQDGDVSSLLQQMGIRQQGKPAAPAAGEEDELFWNASYGQPQAPAAPAAKSPGPAADSGIGPGLSAFSAGFVSWCRGKMVELQGSGDLTLCEFLVTLGSNVEVADYVTLYLGNTPQSAAFTAEFLKRKLAESAGVKSKKGAQAAAASTGEFGAGGPPPPPVRAC